MSKTNFDGWEDTSTTEDLFAMVGKEDNNSDEDTISSVDSDVIDEDNTANNNVTETEEDLFSKPFENVENNNIDNPSEENNNEVEDENRNTSSNIILLNSLKEKGFIDYELEEGEELTEERADEILEDTYDETIEERIKEKLTDLPDDAKNLIQYIIKGGDFNEYIKAVFNNSNRNITENMDLSDESNQELVVRELLRNEDNDEDFIEAHIEHLKDSGRLKSFAEGRYTKWLQKEKQKKTALLEAQENERLKERDRNRESKREVISIINSANNIGGLEISKEDKKVLPGFINDRTIRLPNGNEITELQKELFYEIPKNKKAMVQLASLVKNRNEDGTFNFEVIIKDAQTQLTKNIKKNVRRNNSAIPTSTGGNKGPNQGRSLADIFQDNN